MFFDIEKLRNTAAAAEKANANDSWNWGLEYSVFASHSGSD